MNYMKKKLKKIKRKYLDELKENNFKKKLINYY